MMIIADMQLDAGRAGMTIIRGLVYAAALLLILVFFSTISAAEDVWVEPIVITPANIGSYDVKDEDIWNSEIQEDGSHAGYVHEQYKTTGGNVVVTVNGLERIPLFHYSNEGSSTNYYERNTLRPTKYIKSGKRKDSKATINLYKEIYFDWKNKRVVISPGKGSNVRSRIIPMTRSSRDNTDPERSVSDLAVSFFLRDKKNLVVGNVYDFTVFELIKEKFIRISAKVLREKSSGIFDVLMMLPDAYGDLNEVHLIVGPKSDKYPNGIIYSQEVFIPFGRKSVKISIKKTTKAEATKIEKKKGEK